MPRNPIPVIAMLLLSSLSAMAQNEDPFGVLLKPGTITPARNINDSTIDRLNQLTSRSGGKSFVLIQFERVMSDFERQQLALQGIQLLEYIPNYTYTATITGTVSRELLLRFSARALVEPLAAHKMEPALATGNIPARAMKNSKQAEIWVSYPASFTMDEAIAALTRDGFSVVSTELARFRIISVIADISRLGELALKPYVEYVQSPPLPDRILNDNSLSLSRANVLKAPLSVGGKALTGQGVVVGIGDDGDMQTHIDYSRRLINRTGWVPANHASHVAGTFAGSGLINEYYEGFAPKATIVGQFFSRILTNAEVYIQDHGMVITNNSYGSVTGDCSYAGFYDLNARMLDQLSLDEPLLTNVFAAGNDGAVTCSPYASGFHTVLGGYQSAKNIITVGNSNFNGSIGSTSSRGPVRDGRIKPEITSHGVRLPSTWTGNAYSYNTGTSMAAPGVSGGLALLVEQYRAAHANANPPAGLLKSVVINSGSDKGNAGPDFIYGFGNLNLLRASKMLENNTYFTSAATQGNTNVHNVNVPANTGQLKVTLYWMDPPASLLAAKTLVNDLDLQVTGPGGTVLPYILDTSAANLNIAASTGADHRNNAEQVVINNPATGSYDLSVIGTAITQNPSQSYFLTYDIIPADLTLTNPIGGEKLIESYIVLVPPYNGIDSVFIQWESYGVSESGFTVEFAPDGVTWTTLNNGNPVNGSLRGYNWGVPRNLTTNQARIRVTGNTSGLQRTSDPFVITPTPSVSLSGTQCPGYIQIEWPAMLDVTSYEVMILQGETWVTVATTSLLNYTFSGLSTDSTYWVTVRPLVNGTPARHAYAVSRKPNDGSCTGSISDNDLRLERILTPANSGRLNTSTALANEDITIRIRNLDDVASTGDITVSYSINGGPLQQEVISPANIPAAGYLDHTFALAPDLSAPGTYQIVSSAVKGGDPVSANNSLSGSVRQLSNASITSGDLPWVDDLEAAADQTVINDQMGLTGLDRYDFISGNTDTGRLRTFLNSGIAYSGSKAITLDSWIWNKGTVDSLTATFNLGTFTTTDDIRIEFRYKNHGQDSAHAANKVWIRGSDADNWISIYDLYANQPLNDGSYRLVSSMQINDSLAAHSQNYSSSFQLRIGEWSRLPAADNGSAAGYTFDDFRIYRAVDDIQVLAIDTPVVLACGLNSTVPVKAIVLNTSSSAVNNIPIVLRVDGVTVATESIATIPANDTVHYTFNPGTANLQNSGNHLVEVWVDYPTDNVPWNDTARVTAKNVRFVNSFPYLETFEQSDGTWFTLNGTEGSWQYGTPSSVKINRAASGTRAWKTNIYGYYGNYDAGYLYSPCFDVSGLSVPTLSFSFALDMEDCGGSQCDAAWLDYSTDGGVTWSRLGNTGQGTNWYNRSYGGGPVWSQEDYQRWHVATIPLPTSNNSNIRFRFGYVTDPTVTKEGIAIDDIHVYDNVNGIYTGTGESPVVNQPAVSGTGWVHFIESGQLIASINPLGQNLGSTDVQSYVHTGPVRINKQQYYHNRNITVKPANVNLPDSAIVRFYFLDSETEQLINATGCGTCYKPSMAYELGVTKYSDPTDLYENGTLADNFSGNYLFINAAKAAKVPFDKGYYAEFRVKDFSEFWLNNGGFDNNTPLPVDLTIFTATKTGIDALLKWTTASEANTAKFEIEVARGTDAYLVNNFSKIGEVAAAGNSSTALDYSFLDQELFKVGTRYYRLRIVDLDGSFKFSAVRPVIFNSDITWQVYPNPSEGRYTLTCQLERNEGMIVTLYNTEGRAVRQINVMGSGFPEKVAIDISGSEYPAGLYLLEAVSAGGKQVFRLVKQ